MSDPIGNVVRDNIRIDRMDNWIENGTEIDQVTR